MNSTSSDEQSGQELSKTKEFDNNDLYKFIPPPIPLIPKNKYSDDVPRSYFLMM